MRTTSTGPEPGVDGATRLRRLNPVGAPFVLLVVSDSW
jgi:hypothetical protein